MEACGTCCAVTGCQEATLFLPTPSGSGFYLSPVLAAAAHSFILSFYYTSPTYSGYEYRVAVFSIDPLLSYLEGTPFVLQEHPEGAEEHYRLCEVLQKAKELNATDPLPPKPSKTVKIPKDLRSLLLLGDLFVTRRWRALGLTCGSETVTNPDRLYLLWNGANLDNRKIRRLAAGITLMDTPPLPGADGKQEAQSDGADCK